MKKLFVVIFMFMYNCVCCMQNYNYYPYVCCMQHYNYYPSVVKDISQNTNSPHKIKNCVAIDDYLSVKVESFGTSLCKVASSVCSDKAECMTKAPDQHDVLRVDEFDYLECGKLDQ